jgi:hypothetical protein
MNGHERERLSAYLDRELPPDERAAVEAHLSACPECAAFLAELAAVDEAAASLPAEAPEGYFEGFPARVRARLKPPKVTSPGRRVPAWTWAAAAALLLAVVTPLTLRQLRPSPGEAPSTAPVALQPVPAKAEPKLADEARRPEPPPAASPTRPVPPGRRGPVPAPAPAAAPPTAPQEKAEADFAREPEPLPPAPAQAVVARADIEAAPAPAGNVAAEGLTARGGERLRVAAAEPAAEPEAPAPSAGKAGPALGAADVREPEDAFRRLAAVRPRSAVEWRRLRDEWSAFAAGQPDRLRADEARIRAIVAGREAWLAGGDESDETAFRRDAAAYLQREDALQKPRVERLLAEPRRTP